MRTEDAVAERVRGLLDRQADREHRDEEPDGDRPAPVASSARWRGAVPSWRARVLARIPVRLDPGHRAAVAVGIAVVVAAVITGAWLLASRPQELATTASAPIPGSSPAPSGGASAVARPGSASVSPSVSVSASPPDVVVDVAGKVLRPGLYHLAPGSRVADALAAAGGARAGVDLTSVNLAAPVSDGQQILIGVPVAVGGAAAPGPVAVPTGTGAPGTAGAGGLVNLNSATLEQLETLPGIGPALGQRILDWRSAHGSFGSVAQLNDVSGIGDVKFAALKALVTV